ncbi:hypothetical protein QEH56_10275 [Pelagicoccus enzymogenes]|uniref:hypothetical protein n=1 Tax=Pelagicoccus enzymogenes TaxID=2773457 RepID=UPI00280DEDBB|nr:hypothetical protein [Pelagicoccus enzymogenes]MDQ8198536.1 hypothetical protein [Pelagicoccus enzymogenes]
MQKAALILCFLWFAAFAQAGESLKLLNSDVHAESLIRFLKSSQVASSDASPFVEFHRSERLLLALVKYADEMEAIVYQKREAVWNLRNTDAQKDLAGLQAAKIRHQLAVNAIKQLNPSFAGEGNAAPVESSVKTLIAGVANQAE